MQTRGKGCGILVFVILLLFGIGWLVFTFQGMQLAEESAAWPSVEGEVDRTWIETERREDPDGDTETYYEPFVRYSYQVEGVSYTADRIDFGAKRSYGSRSSANNYLNDYPVGKQVEVFYNPDNPNQAVLVREARGATGSIIAGAAVILVSLVGGIGLLIKGGRKTAKFIDHQA